MDARFDAQRGEFCAYVLAEDETPFGLTLGNFKTFATSTPKGGIRGLWDADTDQIIFGAHQIAYQVEGEKTRFPHQISREFTFLPYAQIAEFGLERDVRVAETFFVPHGPKHDRVVSFVVDVSIHNAGTTPLTVRVFPWALLIGQRFYGEPEKAVRASCEGPFIRSFGEESGYVRWWGGSREPAAAVVALREQTLLAAMRDGNLKKSDHLDEVTPPLAEFVNRRIFGAFEYVIGVAPGARESLRIAVVFHKDGDAHSKPMLGQLLHDDTALHETQRYYATRLADARLLCPSPQINRGVVWAKTNMLRVIKDYPQGWGSTNSPPSDILVSRDTSWFVHGYDFFLPQFSRDAIELFNRNLEESGQVVEYVRGVNGFKTSYDLNINDDTPLHIIAILHHYNATLDDAWLRSVFPLVRKITDYMLSQRDANGLLYCKAGGVDMFGITSWRNIIPYYTLDGAVTEINAEAYFAVEAAAMIAAICDEGDDGLGPCFGRRLPTVCGMAKAGVPPWVRGRSSVPSRGRGLRTWSPFRAYPRRARPTRAAVPLPWSLPKRMRWRRRLPRRSMTPSCVLWQDFPTPGSDPAKSCSSSMPEQARSRVGWTTPDAVRRGFQAVRA